MFKNFLQTILAAIKHTNKALPQTLHSANIADAIILGHNNRDIMINGYNEQKISQIFGHKLSIHYVICIPL